MREKKGGWIAIVNNKRIQNFQNSETTKEIRAFNIESLKRVERGKRGGGSPSPATRKFKILSLETKRI